MNFIQIKIQHPFKCKREPKAPNRNDLILNDFVNLATTLISQIPSLNSTLPAPCSLLPANVLHPPAF